MTPREKSEPDAWRRRGPRVVFTPAGYLLLIFAFVLILDMLNDPSWLKRLAASFTLTVPFVDCLLLIQQWRRLKVTKIWAEHNRSGQPVRVGVTVHNTSHSDALITVRLDAPGQPLAWHWITQQQTEPVFPVQSEQILPRGVYAFPDLGWALHSPLRLCQVRQLLPVLAETPTELLVWPAPWPEVLPPFPFTGAEAGVERGQAQGMPDPREGQLALNTPGVHGWLRSWRQGDRLAHLAHKVSAHRDQWLVQTASSQPQDMPMDVVLTLPWALTLTQDLERALSLLGSMVVLALTNGRRVGLTLGEQVWPPERGDNHKRLLLDALARYVPGDRP